MKSLVVGGCGFIGRALVAHLVSEGHEVCVYDRQPWSGHRFPEGQPEFVLGDLSTPTELYEALAGVDMVFHLAWASYPGSSNEDMISDVTLNVVGSLLLLEACHCAGVGRTIFLSSGGTVYGIPEQNPIPEDHPTRPIGSYGVAKLMVEKYLALYNHSYGLDYVILRPGNAYGEGQYPDRGQGAVATFLGRAARGVPFDVWGDGSVVRDYVYVRDLADACLVAATGSLRHRVYNVGSGIGTSISELIDMIGELAGERPKVQYSPARRLDVPEVILDVRRIRSDLGWTAQTPLKKGLVHTWEWVKRWAAITDRGSLRHQ